MKGAAGFSCDAGAAFDAAAALIGHLSTAFSRACAAHDDGRFALGGIGVYARIRAVISRISSRRQVIVVVAQARYAGVAVRALRWIVIRAGLLAAGWMGAEGASASEGGQQQGDGESGDPHQKAPVASRPAWVGVTIGARLTAVVSPVRARPRQ